MDLGGDCTGLGEALLNLKKCISELKYNVIATLEI